MSLTPGARLGPYEILGSLGAGGMGELYRARDTALRRDVAIKILPDTFAADSDRVARFTREAQALAALNHRNIAQRREVVPDGAAGASAGAANGYGVLSAELGRGVQSQVTHVDQVRSRRVRC